MKSASQRLIAQRLIALLLCALLLLPACSSASTETETTASDPAAAAETETETETETELDDGLPDKDLGGADLTIVTFDTGGGLAGYIENEICVEGETGDALNDAIFQRNLHVMEKYNFKVQDSKVASPKDTIQKAVKGGETLYSGVVDTPIALATIAVQNTFFDYKDLPYINLEQPWWTPNAVRDTSIAGHYYMAVTDILMNDKQRTYGTLFDYELAETLGIDNLYEVVDEGAWTLDKLRECSEVAAQDLDGDGDMDPDDVFGTTTEGYSILPMMIAGGVRMTELDEDGIPQLVFNSERTISCIDKILAVLSDKSIAGLAENHKDPSSGNTYYRIGIDMVGKGQCLFTVGVFSWVQTIMRESDGTVSILPMPKFDESQPEYISTSQTTQIHTLAIPVTCPDTEFVGFAMEALAAASRAKVMPVYYETVVKTRYAADPDAVRMIEIILNNLSFEPALQYDWGGLMTSVRNLSTKGENTFASLYQSAETRVQTAIQKTVDAYNKNAAQ